MGEREPHTEEDALVNVMLVDGGSLSDAAGQVFDRQLPSANENSLIVRYVKCGEPQKALHLYHRTQQANDPVHPNPRVFVALLKACASLKDLKNGCDLHAEIARHGWLCTDPFVSSTLVDMYAKCGLLTRAQEVFKQLPTPDSASWNALISGYVLHDQGDRALECFAQMQLQDISPDAITYVCALKACGRIGATEEGQQIHTELAHRGLLKKHIIVGNALIDMYTKFGFLDKAQEVFDQLSDRDVVTWNSLIAGYAEQGHEEEALKCFERLQHESISPDYVTFICVLKACGSIGASDMGQEVHRQIANTRLLESNLVVGNALVDMYVKCSMLDQAKEVFDKMPVRDIITWNSIIGGYVKHDCNEEALTCLDQMQHEGISPNSITFVGNLKVISNLKAIVKGLEVHSEVVKKGLEMDVLLGSTLLDTYSKCGWLTEAQVMFERLSVQDVVSWTSLIAGYAEYGLCKEALDYFDQMQQEGISPDVVTYACGLKACSDLRLVGRARELHAELERKGLETHPLVCSLLIDMLGKCGLLSEAEEVFDKLPVHDIVSWTALIGGYAEHGQGDKALSYFQQMRTQSVTPNAITYVSCLKACGSIGAIVNGQGIHNEIKEEGLVEKDFLVGNALVDMYAKCGILPEAQDVFEKLSFREIVSWNALIAGYAQQGHDQNVGALFDRMAREGIKPGLVTFVSILNACTHAGLVDKGQDYFKAMKEAFGVIPSLEHYTCMVDLFCRAGQLGKALAMIMKMPIYPDLIIWRAFLSACQKWGNIEFGSIAFEQLMKLDEADSAAYVGMSNIYADVDIQVYSET